ncbi:MAG TPA: SH3 domain-containing protein [Anaerolineae bacterium]|nr:SH3 domain-containing protein [Anaerolineae bacterium]
MKIERISIFAVLAIVLCGAWGYSELYTRAPDTLPGLLPEMYKPSYWIAKMKNPDAIILSTDAILKKNNAYVQRMKSSDRYKGVDPDRVPVEGDLNRWPGRFIVLPDIYNMTPAQLSAFVHEEIGKDINYMRGKYGQEILGLKGATGQKFGNILGIEYADWELDDMEAEMNLANIQNNVKIRDGITVCDERLRVVPTLRYERVGLSDVGRTRWDLWNINVVRICSPVSVLHTSRTGGYLFVLSSEGCGWVTSEAVAFGNRSELQSYCESRDFVVCTGDFVPFYSDESCTYVSGWFRMGDRIPLASNNTPRVINAPFRKMNGEFATERAWLAKNADVSIGYKPYTRRNIVEIGFKLLGNPYDWTMGWYGRNHETTLRDIFACFGFQLPFNAELFTFFGDNDRVVRPKEGKEAQYKAILANEPFATIQTCGGGHSQLFLGEYNGEPIVLDTHGYQYKGEDGKEYLIRRLVVSNMTIPDYFLRTNFSFAELK